MPRHKDSLRIKVKDDSVTIQFNAEGWNPAHTKLIERIGRFYDFGMDDDDPETQEKLTIAGIVGKAFERWERSRYPDDPEHIQEVMRIMQWRVDEDNRMAEKQRAQDNDSDSVPT